MAPPAPEAVIRLRPGVRAVDPCLAAAPTGKETGDRRLAAGPGSHRHLRRGARCSVRGRSAGGPATCRWARPTACAAMAEEHYLREVELPPRRGRILDRNGDELASTADVDSIYCNPRRLAIRARPRGGWPRCWGSTATSWQQMLGAAAVLRLDQAPGHPRRGRGGQGAAPPGVAFTREPRRFYPNRTLAATVMGHAGSDGHGLDGVELALDEQLRGQTSSRPGHPGRAGARPRGRGDGRWPSGGGQRRGADPRQLPDVRHREGAGVGGHRAPRQGRRRGHDGPAHRRGAGDGVVPHLQPERPAQRGRARRAQPRHHRHLRARLDHEDVHVRGGAGRGRGAPRRSVRLHDGEDDGGQVHHPRHPPAWAAHGGRGLQVLEQHRRDQDRAPLGARARWPTRWRASGSADRPASSCRASAPGSPPGGEVGRHRVRQRLVRARPDGRRRCRSSPASARSPAGGIYHPPRIVARVVQPDGTIEPGAAAAGAARDGAEPTARTHAGDHARA